jgi:hypothetical protein
VRTSGETARQVDDAEPLGTSRLWLPAAIWLCGGLSLIALGLAGGYLGHTLLYPIGLLATSFSLLSLTRLRHRASPTRRTRIDAIWFAVVANVVAAAYPLPFLTLAVPAGQSIRPMLWALFAFLLCAGLTVAGLTQSLEGIRKEDRAGKWLGLSAAILSLAPYFSCMFSFVLVALVKGFELAP